MLGWRGPERTLQLSARALAPPAAGPAGGRAGAPQPGFQGGAGERSGVIRAPHGGCGANGADMAGRGVHGGRRGRGAPEHRRPAAAGLT